MGTRNKKNWTFGIIFILGILARWIPHVNNFTPAESITLFSAAYISRKYIAMILPLIMIYLSDLFINNILLKQFFPTQSGIIWWDTYMYFTLISYIFIIVLMRYYRHKLTFITGIAIVISSSLLFYIVTNFGSWMSPSSIYTQDLSGLLHSYYMGLPFLKSSLFSNLVFSGVLFGSYALLTRPFSVSTLSA